MPPKPIIPNRKVRCLQTGKFYVSIQHRAHARYRRYIRTKTEYGLEMTALAREFAYLPEANRKRSNTMKRIHREDPTRRLKMSRSMKNKWDDQDYTDKMLNSMAEANTPSFRKMQSCISKENTTTRNGKPVIRYRKAKRQRSTGVMVQG